jgi:hypothetical protein
MKQPPLWGPPQPARMASSQLRFSFTGFSASQPNTRGEKMIQTFFLFQAVLRISKRHYQENFFSTIEQLLVCHSQSQNLPCVAVHHSPFTCLLDFLSKTNENVE